MISNNRSHREFILNRFQIINEIQGTSLLVTRMRTIQFPPLSLYDLRDSASFVQRRGQRLAGEVRFRTTHYRGAQHPMLQGPGRWVWEMDGASRAAPAASGAEGLGGTELSDTVAASGIFGRAGARGGGTGFGGGDGGEDGAGSSCGKGRAGCRCGPSRPLGGVRRVTAHSAFSGNPRPDLPGRSGRRPCAAAADSRPARKGAARPFGSGPPGGAGV